MTIHNGNIFKHSIIASALATVLCINPVYAADKVNGAVVGQVAQESGASLANVTVKLKHKAKGITRTVTSDASGRFNLKGLPRGQYTATFSKAGYDSVTDASVKVTAGSSVTFNVEMLAESDVERIQIVGTSIQRIDMANSQDAIHLSAEELDSLPVAQDLTSVALLSPTSSVAAGAGTYGRLASFNGSSVAENGYFMNGMNITNIRKGLGNVAFPWEAIAQTSVITGGVPAQYGQFIGGVTNVTSKTGTNEFEFGASAIYTPGDLASQAPDIWRYDNDLNAQDEHDLYLNTFNGENSVTTQNYNVWASGPIIEDKLFFYALLNPKRKETRYANTSTITKKEKDYNYWFASVDWYLTESHSFLVTAFSNETEQEKRVADYSYNPAGGDQSYRDGDWSDPSTFESGGSMWSASYTGLITDDLTITAQYGVTEQDQSSLNPRNDLSAVYDRRFNRRENLGDWVSRTGTTQQEDKRTQYRIDAEWVVGDHAISFGYSDENITTDDVYSYSGPNRQYYYLYTADQNDVNKYPELQLGDEWAWSKEYTKDGSTEQNYRAYYIEDIWSVTDEVTVSLGLRNSSFDAFTGDGDKYVDIKDQWAPRLSVNYDLFGEGHTKLFANYGRYFMPISPNTSVRMTVPEINQRHYAKVIGFDETTNTPITGEDFRFNDYGDGTVAQPASTFVSANIDPMYSDEFSVGAQHAVNDDWMVGIQFKYNKLLSSVEDTNMSYAVKKWAAANPAEADKLKEQGLNIDSSNLALVLNPGQDAKLAYDIDGDGSVGSNEYVNLGNLGLPKAERTYKAVELTLEGKPNDDSRINFSYVYSESKGSTEGLVSGTDVQADPGWASAYDYPELEDNGYGYTSNDMPHKFKLYGSYDITEAFSLGFNAYAQSGRPINKLGYHPLDAGSCAPELDVTDCDKRDGEEFYFQGEDSPRGSHGHSDWVYNLDLSASYFVDMDDYGQLKFKASIYNVFDFDTPTSYNDVAELAPDDNEVSPLNLNYRSPTAFQTPRYVQLSVRYDF